MHPVRQLHVPPGQACALGMERLRLGRMPQGALISRVVPVKNLLTDAVGLARRCYVVHSSRLNNSTSGARKASMSTLANDALPPCA